VRVGFIGLGDMGQGIVPRLLAAGHEVTGWNRTAGKAASLRDLGMRWADTPRQVAEAAEVVLSIVTDAAAVESVAIGEDGVLSGLGSDDVYADMSTIDPDASRRIAAIYAEAGRTMLDAPLSGSPVSLEQGKASVMVGGDRAAFEKVLPVLEAIGPTVTYIGASGMAEAVALAEKGGVDRAVAVDAMLKSVVASPVMGYRGQFILEGNMPDKPLANVTVQQKDMLLALDLGRRQGSPVPLAAAANEMLNACHGLGLSHRDFVTVFDVYRRLGGDE
jgi:3-hydroxyisobutyrate dehydrogenase-like beta-hydroxyacid dehydrogenase